jgi:hypothetical protein
VRRIAHDIYTGKARNNDFRKGDKSAIDILVPSLKARLRRAAEKHVKTFLQTSSMAHCAPDQARRRVQPLQRRAYKLQ